ncbi:transporter substrate-binding domain-containing protein [Maribrevibacterium harenarium]|uniref:Transporter substrate-binding domain-containing protein n=1 Tax=Maribrevibacterium harenarium TaxID=2589817 RepID=A0A501X1G6_9GAMM|nr:transporter substrate-binding domain-containing protein [Maribrevibacterium harenarium]TPE54116.1 transporter substrate-binding domain-containing protein [Maribrevibacterium harenarium]
MKRWLSLVALACWLPVAQAVPLEQLTVRICGTPAYPPVSWVDRSGRVTGLNAQVIKALLEPLGVTVDDQQNSNWRRCLKEVELGNVDVISGFKTEPRQQFLNYLSTPIINEDIYLYYPIDKPIHFQSWQDLAGLRVGILMGDSFGDEADEALRHYPNLEFVSKQDQNILKLVDARLDAVPMGKLSGQLDIRRLGVEGKLGYTATDVSDYWYVAISKHSPLMEHFAELDQRLGGLLADPTYTARLLQQQQQLYLESLGLAQQQDEP